MIVLLTTKIAPAVEPLRFQSGQEQVITVELFTSQGCSSCPPAEKWFNRFREDSQLWKELIPLAFHVNYWDGLGWKDPFATQVNTDRQYKYRSTERLAWISI